MHGQSGGAVRRSEADWWTCVGDEGVWRREHNTRRSALFTPFRLPTGPKSSAQLVGLRYTEGVDTVGRRFHILDDWTSEQNAHRLLDFSWRGRTTFCLQDGVSVPRELRCDPGVASAITKQQQPLHITPIDCNRDNSKLPSPHGLTGANVRWADVLSDG